jgi:hypothetical protein
LRHQYKFPRHDEQVLLETEVYLGRDLPGHPATTFKQQCPPELPAAGFIGCPRIRKQHSRKRDDDKSKQVVLKVQEGSRGRIQLRVLRRKCPANNIWLLYEDLEASCFFLNGFIILQIALRTGKKTGKHQNRY